MAKRPCEVPARVVRELNRGTRETANLAEGLAVDFAVLAEHAGLSTHAIGRLAQAGADGVTKRMRLAGELVAKEEMTARCASHPSDTVRGWACFAIGHVSDSLDRAIDAIRPLADDRHFGVREWAWLGIRPHVAQNVERAIELLAPWAHDDSENTRRFASEATRPRGVWCAHIALLKTKPALGLPVLEPLRGDPTRYVQDSVANWLNDASKTEPEWVASLTEAWLDARPDDPHTARICRRARRSL